MSKENKGGVGAPKGNSNRRKYYEGDTIGGKNLNNIYTLVEVVGGTGYFSCNICSKDQELYPDLFKAANSQIFLAERVICGCGNNFIYNADQLGVIAKRLCLLGGILYLGLSEYKGCHTKFNYRCERGHCNEVSIDQYSRGKHSCVSCFPVVKKLHKGLEETCDYLYIITLTSKDESLVKVGRTFDINKRLTNIKNTLKRVFVVELIHLFTGTHREVVDVEYEIHSSPSLERYRLKDYINVNSFKNEIYKNALLPQLEVVFNYTNQLTEEKLTWKK